MVDQPDFADVKARVLNPWSIGGLSGRLFTTYARWFARPSLIKWNYLLLNLGLRGIGILNYQTSDLSGERYFLEQILRGKVSPVVIDVGANLGNYASMVREHPITHNFQPIVKI